MSLMSRQVARARCAVTRHWPIGTAVRRLSWTVLAAAVGTGAAAGLAGSALTALLHAVEHRAFGYTETALLTGVRQAAPPRRVLALGAGGAVVGFGWWAHRRVCHANVSVTHALAVDPPRLPMVATMIDAVLQIVAVGSGGSLGREGAPRQAGAALGVWVARRWRLDAAQTRVMLAAGAGAGLAAVYNVPLSGAAFALELLLGTWRPQAAVPVLMASVIATATAWLFLGRNPTYHLAASPLSAQVIVAAIGIGPIAGIAGMVFRALMTRARTHAPHGWRAALAMPSAFAALGALAIPYPELLGNGKSLAQLAFTGALTTGLAAALTALKPLATAACLGSGAIGGLLTPSFATGATLGVLLGQLWSQFWPGGAPAGYALAGAAALLAVTQRAPVTATILAIEFTHAGVPQLAPITLAVITAQITAATGVQIRARHENH